MFNSGLRLALQGKHPAERCLGFGVVGSEADCSFELRPGRREIAILERFLAVANCNLLLRFCRSRSLAEPRDTALQQ